MTILSEGRHSSEFLVSEAHGYLSRAAITVGAGANLQAGTVLGRTPSGTAPTATAKSGGNTGNGTISAVTASTGVKIGTYRVEFTAATKFTVTDPEGFVLKGGSTGAAYADEVGFTITAGGTPFVAGDAFDIAVLPQSFTYKILDPSATSGLQIARGILYGPALAASVDVDGVAFVRQAVVNGSEITWPSGITSNQKAAAIQQLEAVNIIVR